MRTSLLRSPIIKAKAENDIRNARAAAQAAIRMRSSFLENMNHELRTPLNAIIGFADMLKDGDTYNLSDDQKKSYTEYILQSADLLLGHINTILEVAALDNGSVEPSHEAVDLSHMLELTIKRVQVQADAAHVKILTASQNASSNSKSVEEFEPVWADPERIGQALEHLLQTAIKSCAIDGRKKGKVFVRISTRRNGWLELQIRDDGTGFTEEELQYALNAFGEVHRGLHKPFTGPSVGIAIAKTFIEMQGGQFTIKSREGKGTLSTIAIPFATSDQLEFTQTNELTSQAS